MKIQLSDHFTYKKLIRFVFPCTAMMVFTSVYGIVDGYFLSNYGGKNSFAAVNLILPFIMGCAALGFMIGSGGSALVSYYLGLKEEKRAKEIFSMLIYSLMAAGILVSLFAFLFMPQIVDLLGASSLIRQDSILYGRISMISLTFFMLGNTFQSFFTVAERPRIGLWVALLAGCLNMFLDYLLVYYFDLGVVGAATATVVSEYTGGLIPLCYFLRKNQSTLQLVPARPDLKVLAKACGNGISELMTNLASSVISMFYNMQLMKYAAENGIAAFGVIMYVSFIFSAIYYGYTIGINPLVGYHYGASNKKELRNLLKKSLVLTGIVALLMTAFSQLLAGNIASLFVGYDQELFALTKEGFRIYALSYLISGFNIFASAFFTGLNNGRISATISMARTFVIQVLCIMILPLFFGLNGIWGAVLIAEILTLFLSAFFFKSKQRTYGY